MLDRESRMIAEQERMEAWDEFELTNILHRVTTGIGTNVGFLAEEIVKQLSQHEVILLVERLNGIISEQKNG